MLNNNYYRRANNIFVRNEYIDKPINQNCKYLIIYFDYEREFGNPSTNFSDSNFYDLIEVLKHYHIRCSWYTVGRVIERYPNTIETCQLLGHEIGSHTYNHTIVNQVSKRVLESDFIRFENIKQEYNIIGFRFPQGIWNCSSLRLLKKYGYSYDIVMLNGEICRPFYSHSILSPIKEQDRVIRFPSLCSDWLAYEKKLTGNSMFEYYKAKLKMVKYGDIAAIGFHPWVLYSNAQYRKAFEMVIDYVVQNEFVIQPAREMYESFESYDCSK